MLRHPSQQHLTPRKTYFEYVIYILQDPISKRLKPNALESRVSSPLKPIIRRASSRSKNSTPPKKVTGEDLELPKSDPAASDDQVPVKDDQSPPASTPAWKDFYDAVNVLGAVRHSMIYGADIDVTDSNYQLCLNRPMPEEYSSYEQHFKTTFFNLVNASRDKNSPEEQHRRWTMALQVRKWHPSPNLRRSATKKAHRTRGCKHT